MGEMSELNGLLILAGIGGKKKGHGGREKKRAERVLKKIPPRSKNKKRGAVK